MRHATAASDTPPDDLCDATRPVPHAPLGALPPPGLLALHGNAVEDLADTLIDWTQRQRLPLLAQDVVLVQSNGTAEWFKMRMAQRLGICAAVHVELPARFVWRTWRQVLGPGQLPASGSALDETPLTWRLLRLLPALLDAARQCPQLAQVLQPLQDVLGEQAPCDSAAITHGLDTASAHMLALCARLAALLDQYQVYRSDWLALWEAGRYILPRTVRGLATGVAASADTDGGPMQDVAPSLGAVGPNAAWVLAGQSQVVPPEALWQPLLWRALLLDLDDDASVASSDENSPPDDTGVPAGYPPQSVVNPWVERAELLLSCAALPQAVAGSGRHYTRTAVGEQVLQRMRAAPPGSLPIAPRVMLLGLSHVPQATLEFLAALSSHTQVVLAVPNPCRYYWADAIDGRELLRMVRRRHAVRPPQSWLREQARQHSALHVGGDDGPWLGGAAAQDAASRYDPARIALQDMHAHAHPLLATWGRQSRDYIRLLDQWDTLPARGMAAPPRVDLFDDAPADSGTLLQQVQRSIRDLLPLDEHPRRSNPRHSVDARRDRSIVFHSAHSLLRELEVLHDALLDALAATPEPGQSPLQPRDIVVMLPDIEAAAPSIRAVFGQYPRGDARHIPYGIADLGSHSAMPLAAALDWLLAVDAQRITFGQLCDFLDVPALAARLGIDDAGRARLRDWMQGAGIRWGLDTAHRASLQLAQCGDTHSARFGLHRMLLGFATGELDAATIARRDAACATTCVQTAEATLAPFSVMPPDAPPLPEPYDEIGGLDAALVGVLDALLHQLSLWWEQARADAPPAVWAQRLRTLVQQLFSPVDEAERAILQTLDDALTRWTATCAQARCTQRLPLSALRRVWQNAATDEAQAQRFHAGGVTFCTPMPMRAIPFEMVCLLGMNEGDFPRRSPRSSFDLTQLKGQHRAGDRARQDNDRQLMLDALLSARRTLYISWSGRSVRDNSAQPPSVLVAQLRDYLAAGWRSSDEIPGDPAAADGTVPGGDLATSAAHSPLLRWLTHQHPLQPFSRSYFEAQAEPQTVSCNGQGSAAEGLLHTHAREWRSAHVDMAVDMRAGATAGGAAGVEPSMAMCLLPTNPPAALTDAAPLTIDVLSTFLRHPARVWFAQRLGVRFNLGDVAGEDDEIFALDALQTHHLIARAQQHISAAQTPDGPGPLSSPATPLGKGESAFSLDVSADGPLLEPLQQYLHHMQRNGELPLAGPGRRALHTLALATAPSLHAWQRIAQSHPHRVARQPLHIAIEGHILQDWLDGRYSARQSDSAQAAAAQLESPIMAGEDGCDPFTAAGSAVPLPMDEAALAQLPHWLQLDARTLTHAEGRGRDRCLMPRPEVLLGVYVRAVTAAACGVREAGWLIGRDAALHILPLPADAARRTLRSLMAAWAAGQNAPLPLPRHTALAWAAAWARAQVATPDADATDTTADDGPSAEPLHQPWAASAMGANSTAGNADAVTLASQTAAYTAARTAAARCYADERHPHAEQGDLYWSRLYPDFAALAADGQFFHWAHTIYLPLLHWSHCAVRVWEYPKTNGKG